MVILYSPRCLDYAAAGHPENPERVRAAVAQLQKEFHTWVVPTACTDEDILRVHTREQLEAVRSGGFDDVDTPFFPDIFEIAKLFGRRRHKRRRTRAGRPTRVFPDASARPPRRTQSRNGVLLFQQHRYRGGENHGSRKIEDRGRKTENWEPGTENRNPKSCHPRFRLPSWERHGGHLSRRRACAVRLVASIALLSRHGFRVRRQLRQLSARSVPPEEFLETFDKAIDRIRGFDPQLLAVSAGFDSFKNDPITHMGLEVETFYAIGRCVADFTQPTSTTPALPCFAVLEGGYAREFAQCVDAFVGGWERH